MKSVFRIRRILLAALAITLTTAPKDLAAQAAKKPSKVDMELRQKSTGRLGRIARHGDRAVALYPDRLELFDLTPDEQIDGNGNFVRGNTKRAPSEAVPSKILWFSRAFGMKTETGSPNILICTAHWTKKVGSVGLDDFCGIVTYTGETIYKFPITQRAPSRILFPLGISPDGKHAEVYVGSLIDGEDGKTPGAPREILIWEYPDKLTRLDGPWKTGVPKDTHAAYEQVRKGFAERAYKR